MFTDKERTVYYYHLRQAFYGPSPRERNLAKSLTLTPWPASRQNPDPKRLGQHLCVEIIGLPNAGKSTVINMLETEIKSLVFSREIIIRREFQETGVLSVRGQSSLDLQEASFDAQMAKIANYMAVDNVILRNRRELVLIERGPTDFLCQEHAFAPRVSNPENPSDYKPPDRIQWTMHALNFAEELDAVILFGISFSEAIKRELCHGGRRFGWVRNPIVWPHMLYGYDLWKEFLFPQVRKANGMGLLVVDGNQSPETNFQQVRNYLYDILNQA